MAEVHSNLGEAFRAHGQLDQAIASCRQAIALQPNYPEAHSNLGNSLAASGHFDEAIAEQQRALAIKPDLASAHCNLGNALREAGQVDRALEVLRNAVARWPGDPEMHSFLILTLLHQPGEFGIALRETCRQWGERHGAPLGECVPAHGNSVDPRRRLRVGYVSADFSSHVVSRFLTPLLEGHDHVEFEICCYASVRRPDQVTERLKKTADLWRNVVGFTDEKLAAQIRADAIDILVDLTMHSAGNRLLAFARKPAPVQVAWLGHPGSTGLRAVDYRLTDASMDPAGSEWADSVENAVRLPDSWFCYDPLEEFPPPGELPARKAGYVTFGSLNSFPKMNEAVVRRWAAVLSAVAGSKLLMRCPEGEAQTRLRRLFAAHGIGSERMELVSWLSAPAEFLQLYQRIDIGLDPFPFNGGTTTCEALWMGVPVLTVPGSAAVSRIGLSILSAAGLANFVAETEEEFVFLAVRLATDLDLLANLRSTLRQRMKTSAYMDGPRFARNVEQAYREMWRQWCEKQTAKFSRP